MRPTMPGSRGKSWKSRIATPADASFRPWRAATSSAPWLEARASMSACWPDADWALQDQRRGDLAAFRDQDVVGAAGRGRVHDFHAGACAGQALQEFAAREAQLWPGSQQQDF